jgi:transglutaminase-like putative cysteine protease
MTFAQYFKASSYCLIASGFAAIAATGRIDWVSVVLFSIAFAGSWFIDTVRLQQAIPAWILRYLALAYLPFCAIDYKLLSHSYAITILHLFFFAAAVKLLTFSKDRDYLLLYLISFAELLVASTFTVDIAFILCFLVFLLSGISTLILYEMRRSNAKMQEEAEVQPFVVSRKLQGTGLELFSPFPARFFSAMVIGITLLIIAGAIPLFFLLPRITRGMYPRPSGNAQFISGFSDRVELGQVGRIKQSDAVVMRVRTVLPPSQLPPDLKWRGLSFDYYDGRSWRRSDRTRRPISIQGWYYKIEDSAQGTNWIHQTFFIEALSTDVVFATHRVLAVSRDVGTLRRDSSENLYTTRHLKKKLRYSAVSDPISPNPANISDRAPIPQEILSNYLQLPVLDPRIADLAKQVTGMVKGRYAKARALEQYLRSHYAYSLILAGTPNSSDPLAMFLFDVRKGHCEYYASAMAVMLRQIGIPSRLVNGFRAGEYNRIGDDFTVRQYNAHSWVEAYFPPYGWIEFDPTPFDPQNPRTAFARLISDLTDAIDLWWWEGVVNYDSSKQYRVLTALQARIDRFQQGLQNLLGIVTEKGRGTVALLYSPSRILALGKRWASWIPWFALAVLLLIKPIRKRIAGLLWHTLGRNNSRAVATRFYAQALYVLDAYGLKRSREQTPMEFALSLGNHPAAAPLLALTRMYNAVRFGPPEAPLRRSEAVEQLQLLSAALHPNNKKAVAN